MDVRKSAAFLAADVKVPVIVRVISVDAILADETPDIAILNHAVHRPVDGRFVDGRRDS